MLSLLTLLPLACTGDLRVRGWPEALGTDTRDASETDCALGRSCNPIGVDALPFEHTGTTVSLPSEIDAYDCAVDTDESGGDVFYRLDVQASGLLTATVLDDAGVDVDVHLLTSPDGSSCATRGDTAVAWVVTPGAWWIVLDTWVDGDAESWAGDYTLQVGWQDLDVGACALRTEDLRMYWDDCAPGVDCERVDGDVVLHTPAIGEAVMEAHLVTDDEVFAGDWPGSFTEGIEQHYALSEAVSGYAMDRQEPWAPAGEGGSEFGQGATGAAVPADAEAWAVNMYWRDRPAKGTPMLVMNPFTGAAVVAAGGYETGPGSNTAIGGAVEEIHHALGTGHRDTLLFGFLEDESQALGPIDCGER